MTAVPEPQNARHVPDMPPVLIVGAGTDRSIVQKMTKAMRDAGAVVCLVDAGPSRRELDSIMEQLQESRKWSPDFRVPTVDRPAWPELARDFNHRMSAKNHGMKARARR